jgi:hypothetical protein
LSDTFVILLIDFVSLTLTHTVSVSAFGRTTIHAMKRRNRDLTGGANGSLPRISQSTRRNDVRVPAQRGRAQTLR